MIGSGWDTGDGKFGNKADLDVCRRLHKQFGTTYYFSTMRFPRVQRLRTHALYGFVRVPDEWVDNPGAVSRERTSNELDLYRAELLRGVDGVKPQRAVLRAFCDVMRETKMPLEEPLRFLDAMRQDLYVDHYETFEDLCGYMRGSAAAIGVMMCYVLDSPPDKEMSEAAAALGNAMQLTNFLRDIAEDADRGRIYLPRADMRRFQVTEADLLEGVVSERFRELMKFEIDRARKLYEIGDTGIQLLPKEGRRAVKMARVLYSRILDRIEQQNYDVFRMRARTGRVEKLALAAQYMLSL